MKAFTKQVIGCSIMVLASLLLASGCDSRRDAAKDKSPDTGKQSKKDDKGHAHPEKGPHGGPLAEWGEEKYHAEFTSDHAKKQATVYILDGAGKKAAPIVAESITLSLTNAKPPVQITLKADPQEGDPKGQASRFTGTHEILAKEMEFEGEISGKVGDTPYAGTFKDKEHDHKHDKKK